MANREENIKKINEELEKLDDEQLEQIAGGRFFTPDFTPDNPEVRIDTIYDDKTHVKIQNGIL